MPNKALEQTRFARRSLPALATMNTVRVLIAAGQALGFEVQTEVGASDSAWIDVVWFDPRLPLSACAAPKARSKPRLPISPAIPVVGFEIEHKTAHNAKHVKGSVSNLNNLGAQLGVIVLGKDNLAYFKKQEQHRAKTDSELELLLRRRATHWVHAEARPQGRIAVMLESEVEPWVERLKATTRPSVCNREHR